MSSYLHFSPYLIAFPHKERIGRAQNFLLSPYVIFIKPVELYNFVSDGRSANLPTYVQAHKVWRNNERAGMTEVLSCLP